ncbi:tegument serine/threonine protein kinase [Common bottlenose dolphin gammaherpesvirus 1 strain Sarasota]|uniref:Tegument serine/threonine protein kinase n=1 Tax=Common bottlenose dolphin gammaherpesvirus 1 strain Sarasota TaxID=2022783 RepID=A0A1Z1NE94_9GAMA|nr:tegument serine/threonine protein kinase [Common bottlenose dolphin gammaherpesvirus 1 strain Sarasota]ARW78099.1 tegument serine/threonine protein kinase [Common bottlenose dolphin gammaherpesvirus 1 strain Sarasota]
MPRHRPSRSLMNATAAMTASRQTFFNGGSRPPRASADSPLPLCTAIDKMGEQPKHLTATGTDKEHRTIYARLPSEYNNCAHGPVPKHRPKLGEGAFGCVYPVTDDTCVKVFTSHGTFYHEFIMNDLIALAMIHRDGRETRHHALLNLMNACVQCRVIFYPRCKFGLNKFRNWCPSNIPPLICGFEGLHDAIVFLNEKCGIFHSDVSPCNILIEDAGRGKLGRLVLTDMGISSPHDGNRFNRCVLKSNKGKPLYEISSTRNPFMVCKDAFKPAFLLSRCHTLKQRIEFENLEAWSCPIGQRLALDIDTASLGYTLLYALERLLVCYDKDPTLDFYCKNGTDNQHLEYYLQFLVPKVVLCNLLSRIWNVQLHLGVNMRGETTATKLSPEHVTKFARWVEQFKTRLELSATPRSTDRIKNPQLAHLTCKLLSQDYFSEHGHGSRHLY